MNKGYFYLDREKDIIVELTQKGKELLYVLKTPNHNSGNLITNIAKVCHKPISYDENGMKIIKGVVPSYIDGNDEEVNILRLGNTKVASIYPDGSIQVKASIPAISKTLMSQTKDYQLDEYKTIIKTYIIKDNKFTTDLHTHMNANLSPDILIALGIANQIRYPLYYIKKLNLSLSDKQTQQINKQRERVEKQFIHSDLTGKYLTRKIDDNTFINFADLILNNLIDSYSNIVKIRSSLSIMKDGQAVFTNLEKVYIYRNVFTKGKTSDKKIKLKNINRLEDKDIVNYLKQMLVDKESEEYRNNNLYQDKLLWIARSYKAQGVKYAEISDTSLASKTDAIDRICKIHEVMPKIENETKVKLRFLVAIRRIPLTIIKDDTPHKDYLDENIAVLKAVCTDPYIVGSDFVGEEINDIRDLKPVLNEIVKLASKDPYYTIRIHAGENDSLTNNVASSISLVQQALANKQKMPKMRIGHGLYTANLNSPKGKALIKQIVENNIILEFQLTSNIRLNNSNSLADYPLKQYLQKGVKCVQGTDGCALYGTSPIEEQLSLEKLLDLSNDEMQKMKKVEEEVYSESVKAFEHKNRALKKALKDTTIYDYYSNRVQKELEASWGIIHSDSNKCFSQTVLRDKIGELPWDKHPIIIAGGSFNTDQRKTTVRRDYQVIIDDLLEQLDPNEVFFVIGHKLQGYEKYLVAHNTKFKVFAFVPLLLDTDEVDRLQKADVQIRVSTEAFAMGIYKSINYEIFERRPSTLIVLDGNSAALNLIQEAKNGKGKAHIYLREDCQQLQDKAKSLVGYVQLFNDYHKIYKQIIKAMEKGVKKTD